MLALKTGLAVASASTVVFSKDRPRAGPSSCLNLTKRLGTQKSSLSSLFVTKAAESSTSQPSTSADKAVVPDDEFSLAKVSFGVIGMGGGFSLLSYGFGAYFNILPSSEWSAIMLTYGFPLAVIGMALKYAELKPVPCLTYVDARRLRETCAIPILIPILKQVPLWRRTALGRSIETNFPVWPGRWNTKEKRTCIAEDSRRSH